MSLTDKYAALSSLLTEHNNNVDPKYQINIAETEERFKAAGGTTEERLKSLSYEDILKLMPSTPDAPPPIMLAKDIARLFRNTGTEIEESASVSSKRAEGMTRRELLEKFDPRDPASHIARRLDRMAENKPFVILSDEGKVDVASSLQLLDEIQQGFPPRAVFQDAKGGQRVPRRVTDKIPVSADENPLYPARPLRPDGTCDQLNRSWTGVPADVRSIVYLAVSRTDEIANNPDSRHAAMDVALTGLGAVTRRYPRAAALYGEQSRLGDAPRLKLAVNQTPGKTNSPLDAGTKVKL